MKNNFAFALGITAILASCGTSTTPILTVDTMGIDVDATENREYSYSDKLNAYYYGRTHTDHFGEWYAGWNVKQRRIVSDYSLYVDTALLQRQDAQVTVYPHCLSRKFKLAREHFSLVDNKNIIVIELDKIKGNRIAIELDTTLVTAPRIENDILWYTPRETPEFMIAIAPYKTQAVKWEDNKLYTAKEAGGFLLAYGNEATCLESINSFRINGEEWLTIRKNRMNNIVTRTNPMKSNIDSLDKAIAWLLLTTDELITQQQGHGIYAGLPWFNEYWGRDMFISMPGATLVNGQFEVTREILKDFSRLQDCDVKSPTFGRIPNRANMDGILYNTTDGTPRFVMQIADYVRYSGDTAFIHEIYPAVARSINASIALFTDDNGYLCHDDADTWMDVKRLGIPGSPRGNRANDIQALWYNQLMDGAYMARYVGDELRAIEWESRAQYLKENFKRDFCDTTTYFVADHLNTDGSRDLQVRPNQLYTFELIDDPNFCSHVTRRIWEELVYPWGVGSLSQYDDNFHPQHENWHYYHKDDAYHNGTVWLWNNGHAMQRMIEMGQPDIAWQLFSNMNRQALMEGAVGSLSENADAHPRAGKSWANRSGTFLQAWSNAEQLRIWYQYFLGIRPDMVHNTITVNPQLPSTITSLTWSQRVGYGDIIGSYERIDENKTYGYILRSISATLHINIPLYKPFDVTLNDGDVLFINESNGNLRVQVTKANAQKQPEVVYEQDAELVRKCNELNNFFEGCTFCKPIERKNLKAFEVYHEEALTY